MNGVHTFQIESELRTLKDIILVTVYSKLDQGDISTKEIRRILKLFQAL